jgi:hypothetical protein
LDKGSGTGDGGTFTGGIAIRESVGVGIHTGVGILVCGVCGIAEAADDEAAV